MIKTLSSSIIELGKNLKAAEEMPAETPIDPAAATPVEEEKDKDTLLTEHVKNNIDKYRKSFEALFPKAQMVAKNVEYHGAVDNNKIRVMVEFETPMLNFDALEIMANKDIGIEATGEKIFRVYNIYLPRVKDTTIKESKEPTK